MSDSNVIKLAQPGAFTDSLTEILRRGARALLTQAVEAEVDSGISVFPVCQERWMRGHSDRDPPAVIEPLRPRRGPRWRSSEFGHWKAQPRVIDNRNCLRPTPEDGSGPTLERRLSGGWAS